MSDCNWNCGKQKSPCNIHKSINNVLLYKHFIIYYYYYYKYINIYIYIYIYNIHIIIIINYEHMNVKIINIQNIQIIDDFIRNILNILEC